MPNGKEIGGTGTIILNGMISMADYNSKLTGRSRIDEFDKMRLGDGTVRAAYLAVTLPILSANWYIDTENEKKKAWFEKQLFNNPDFSWTAWLRDCLVYLAHGSRVFEKVYKKEDDGKIGILKLAVRLPKTIMKWAVGKEGNEFGITQMLPDGKQPEIPGWKLLVFVNEQEGENYEGLSLFRSAYKHWVMKEAYYKIDALATEKQGLGIPKVEIPTNASEPNKTKMRTLLKEMRANEKAYLEHPQGWVVEFMDMKANGIKDATPMILHHDRQITKSVLAQFLELGQESGSRALSQDHSELFYLSLNAIAKQVAEIINEKLIKELDELNFPDGEPIELKYSKIGRFDIALIAEALTKMSGAGLLTKDAETEVYIRQMMNLPELPEEMKELKDEQVKNPPQPMVDTKGKPLPQNKPQNGKPVEAVELDDDIKKLQEKINAVITASEQSHHSTA